MDGFGSGRYLEQMVPRPDSIPAVAVQELQKRHVFSDELVLLTDYESLDDAIHHFSDLRQALREMD